MPVCVKWGLATVVTGLVAATVLGQPLSPPSVSLQQGYVETYFLLANKGVQKELKLTREQTNKIQKVLKAAQDKHDAAQRKLVMPRDLSKLGELQREYQSDLREQVDKIRSDVLAPEQDKRFKEIDIQVNIARYFVNRKLREELKDLNLTDDQRRQIGQLVTKYEGRCPAVINSDRDGKPMRPERLPAAFLEMRKMADQLTDDILALLTDEQKRTWREKTGDRFEFKLDVVKRPPGRP